MKTVLFVLGTRPEAIKLCPVIRCFRESLTKTRVVVCSTGQHREMIGQALRFFEVKPDYDLDVMTAGQSLFGLSSRLIGELETVCNEVKPDYLIVQGDTTTAIMGALAGYYCGARVVHIEAGLRTGNMAQPFPEEGNRVLVSRLTQYHFAPTNRARENLLSEGIDKNIHVVGNTVVDALLWALPRARMEGEIAHIVNEASKNTERIILVTGHRRESFGKPFEQICEAIREIAKRNDVQIIYPVHMNPNVRTPVNAILGGVARVHLVEPVDYPAMVSLLKCCHLVLTDSGGIQEEAPSVGKPVLVMRNTTERPEGIEAGTSRLVGSSRSKIVTETNVLLDNPDAYREMAGKINPYGDGHASEKMLGVLAHEDGELR